MRVGALAPSPADSPRPLDRTRRSGACSAIGCRARHGDRTPVARRPPGNRFARVLAALILGWAGALPAAHATAMAPPAAAADGEHLRLGRLDFAPCELGTRHHGGLATQAAYCTRVDVPENWDDPGGRHILLRVAVVKSQGADSDRDLVTFLDGGPGGAATEDYLAIAPALAPLRRRHHLLLIDQRGTGGSNALDCGEDLALADDRRILPAAARAERAAARQRAATRRCLDALAPRAAPQFYATTDAVRDLEAVRQALGAVPLDLVGVSYGTRVAQQYAAAHPGAVRSIVLDSPVPNRLALLSEHARNLEAALRRRLERCGATAACARRFGDSYAMLRRVHADLKARPQEVELRDPLTFDASRHRLGADELAQLVRFYLYGDTTSALLPLVIDEAGAGRYATVLAQAQLVVGDVAEHLSGGMSASVMCTEDADLLRDQPEDDGTLLGAGVVRAARDTCAVWPHRDRPAAFHEAFASAIPVLVLAGEFDPVTPPRYASEIAAGLAHARVLLAPGQGHAVLGIGCMPRLVAAFVRDRDPGALDDACLHALGDTPAFLSVNGPAP